MSITRPLIICQESQLVDRVVPSDIKNFSHMSSVKTQNKVKCKMVLAFHIRDRDINGPFGSDVGTSEFESDPVDSRQLPNLIRVGLDWSQI